MHILQLPFFLQAELLVVDEAAAIPRLGFAESLKVAIPFFWRLPCFCLGSCNQNVGYPKQGCAMEQVRVAYSPGVYHIG